MKYRNILNTLHEKYFKHKFPNIWKLDCPFSFHVKKVPDYLQLRLTCRMTTSLSVKSVYFFCNCSAISKMMQKCFINFHMHLYFSTNRMWGAGGVHWSSTGKAHNWVSCAHGNKCFLPKMQGISGLRTVKCLKEETVKQNTFGTIQI